MFRKLFRKRPAFSPALLIQDELERFVVCITADQIEKMVLQLDSDARKTQTAILKTIHYSWKFIKYLRQELDVIYDELGQENPTQKIPFVDIFTTVSSFTMFYLMQHHLKYRQNAGLTPNSKILPMDKESATYFDFLFEILNGIRDYCTEFTDNAPKRFSHTQFLEQYKAYAHLLSIEGTPIDNFKMLISGLLNVNGDGAEQAIPPSLEYRKKLAISSALSAWELPAYDQSMWRYWNNSVW